MVNRQWVMYQINKSLKSLNFDNRTLQRLPIDSIKQNYVRRVKDACFSLVQPTKLDNPRLVCHSKSALQLIDLNDDAIDDYFIECFSGNAIIPGSEPAAHCYCGHQFGVFAGQLGDGAAIYLGEIVNSKQERWELQLKGAGLTPYSRDADGRKVLRSSLREFLCSEAMHSLKISTTRAATCIVSDTKVPRDQFYDGNTKMEQCAVISRIAPTFIRFGSFEITKKLDPSSGRIGPSFGNRVILHTMINFVIESYFPTIHNSNKTNVEKYKLFFREVVIKTAKLVAQWQAYGFVHGVLNTDNMSIMGLTLDYGPFGFMDRFDPDHIPNTSDHDGRYRYKKQPEICLWNLLKFAEALELLVPYSELKEIAKEFYLDTYKNKYTDLMMNKLGLFKRIPEEIIDQDVKTDHELIEEFLETLDKVGGDYTNCFRYLNLLTIPGIDDFENSLDELKKRLMEQSSDLEEMKKFYQNYLDSPMIYLRILVLQNSNNRPQDEETLAMLAKIQYYKLLKDSGAEEFTKKCEELWDSWLSHYIERIKYEIRDLNQDELKIHDSERRKLMNSHNPRYVLRNYLAQRAIEKAEQGDFGEVQQLLKALEDPFSENPEFDLYTLKPPKVSCSIRVSCSS